MQITFGVVHTFVGMGLLLAEEGNFKPPLCSILSGLYSVVPASISGQIQAKPAIISDYANAVEAGYISAWYTDLPDDVTAWLSSAHSVNLEDTVSSWTNARSSHVFNALAAYIWRFVTPESVDASTTDITPAYIVSPES